MSPFPDHLLPGSRTDPPIPGLTGKAIHSRAQIPNVNLSAKRKRKRSSCAQPDREAAKRTRQLLIQPGQVLQKSGLNRKAPRLSETSRSAIESWLDDMPPRRRRPDAAGFGYLASPPADGAQSVTSKYSISRASAKSSRSSGAVNIAPDNSQYRQHLSRRNCEISAKNVEVPLHIRDEAMAIWEHPRSSP